MTPSLIEMLMPTLVTARLIIQPCRMDDLETCHRLYLDTEWADMKASDSENRDRCRIRCASGHRLWRRFTVHYTPKHGSWLNPAELEASLSSRQCLGRQRVASLTELRERTTAWNRWANRTKLKIDWRFSTADARRVFHYQRIATHESKH